MHLAHHDNPGHLGLRTKEYKLIYYYGVSRDGKLPSTPPAWELYDLTKDPQELVNVYDEPAYANIVTDLKRELASRRQQIGDDGQDYPEIEAVVQEFWNYDAPARAKAVQISHEFLAKMKAALAPTVPKKGKRVPD